MNSNVAGELEPASEYTKTDEATDDVVDPHIPGPIYVARFALALLRLPEDQEPVFTGPAATQLAKDVDTVLREALAKDSRVSEVLSPNVSYEVDNARTQRYFGFDEEETNLLNAVEARHALRLNAPIRFRVQVPIKNQPRYRSLDDVPSIDYLAVWDGVSLGVQWRQEDGRATGSGGHVVLEVLESVGKKTGYPVDIMACSLGCLHRFMHIDVVSIDDEDALSDHYHLIAPTPVGTAILSPRLYATDDVVNLTQVYTDLQRPLDLFMEAKALADQIQFLEARSRLDSANLLAIGYERASRRRMPHVGGAIADLWGLRGSRRQTRQLLAGLWLGLAWVDSAVGLWRTHVGHLDEVLEAPLLSEIAHEFDAESNAIRNIDLSLVRAALEETANRIEGRTLTVATLSGAAAALAGSALTAVLT